MRRRCATSPSASDGPAPSGGSCMGFRFCAAAMSSAFYQPRRRPPGAAVARALRRTNWPRRGDDPALSCHFGPFGNTRLTQHEIRSFSRHRTLGLFRRRARAGAGDRSWRRCGADQRERQRGRDPDLRRLHDPSGAAGHPGGSKTRSRASHPHRSRRGSGSGARRRPADRDPGRGAGRRLGVQPDQARPRGASGRLSLYRDRPPADRPQEGPSCTPPGASRSPQSPSSA